MPTTDVTLVNLPLGDIDKLELCSQMICCRHVVNFGCQVNIGVELMQYIETGKDFHNNLKPANFYLVRSSGKPSISRVHYVV